MQANKTRVAECKEEVSRLREQIEECSLYDAPASVMEPLFEQLNVAKSNLNAVMSFPVLAGVGNVNDVVTAELKAAGIDAHTLPSALKLKGDVATNVMGELCGWTFQRRWRYWLAEGPGLPSPYCDELHEQVGGTCRVDGDCTAPSPAERFKGLAVNVYHVDTQEALNALADTLRKVTGYSAAS